MDGTTNFDPDTWVADMAAGGAWSVELDVPAGAANVEAFEVYARCTDPLGEVITYEPETLVVIPATPPTAPPGNDGPPSDDPGPPVSTPPQTPRPPVTAPPADPVPGPPRYLG